MTATPTTGRSSIGCEATPVEGISSTRSTRVNKTSCCVTERKSHAEKQDCNNKGNTEMPDIAIAKRYVRGQQRLLLIAETERGKRFLKNNYVSVSELVSIQGDDSDLEEIIENMKAEELEVEVG